MTEITLNPGVTSDERTTHTLEATQLWRQVGWLGQSGRVYALDDEAGLHTEPASFLPLWILVEDNRPVEEDET